MVYTPFNAGQTVTAGQLDTLIASETMPWTQLDSVGVLVSGFTIGTPAARMRKLMLAGTEIWEFEGRITIASLTANANTVAFTFNTGFRVGTERGFQCVGANTAFYGVRVTFEPNGQLMVGVPTAAGSGATGVLLDNCTITNPLA
ncbi:hypothetical protein [Actinacidiphila rubida]|uniref:Uncharacterized protein n=1 Tax=Actinacidiphila rubida TaxID=310780 RepID=A0A1H8SZ45_9ACTN|nr:hypothetical protein [Actinacidiphila rubida]SEO83628.1 hypothetical protein SAMN05216267_104656 [Actinacidiphila rubida]